MAQSFVAAIQEDARESARRDKAMARATRRTQAQFVRELIGNVQRDLLRDVAAGRIPEEWNGIQLRALLAERFKRAQMGREGERRFWRDYRNEVIVRNL